MCVCQGWGCVAEEMPPPCSAMACCATQALLHMKECSWRSQWPFINPMHGTPLLPASNPPLNCNAQGTWMWVGGTAALRNDALWLKEIDGRAWRSQEGRCRRGRWACCAVALEVFSEARRRTLAAEPPTARLTPAHHCMTLPSPGQLDKIEADTNVGVGGACCFLHCSKYALEEDVAYNFWV